VGVTPIGRALPPKPSTPCMLDIYTNTAEITRPYEELCLIDSRTGITAFHYRTAAEAIRQARPEACRCGADAMIVASARTEGAAFGWGMGAAVIKAIHYTDAETTTTLISKRQQSQRFVRGGLKELNCIAIAVIVLLMIGVTL